MCSRNPTKSVKESVVIIVSPVQSSAALLLCLVSSVSKHQNIKQLTCEGPSLLNYSMIGRYVASLYIPHYVQFHKILRPFSGEPLAQF